MHCTAASPLDSMEIGPGARCPGIVTHARFRPAHGAKARTAAGKGKTIRYFLAPQDTTAADHFRVHPAESRQPWMGSLKALLWTAAAIGLALAIAAL